MSRTFGIEPALTVVLPCFNEAGRLPRTLARVREYLAGRGEAYEILVVDDGSSDQTAALAAAVAQEDPSVRVLRYAQNRGKGYAVAFGMQQARAPRVLFSDADLSTPIEELGKMLPLLEEGYDVVIGSRALKGSDLRVRQPWWRERLGRIMNRCIRALSGLSFPDTQCGFKLFTREAARAVFSRATVDGWLFDVEALVLAQRLGYRITDVPVRWENSPDSRVKLSHAFRTLEELLYIRMHWLRRRPARSFPDETEVATQTAP
jgi:dolichyl-phosphate beta-glucosyltransferase